MRIAQALDFLHAITAAQFESLSDLIPSEFITTLRRRRMPMERLVWVIIGMAIFRNIPMAQLVNQLDILLPSDRPSPPAPSRKLGKNSGTRASSVCFTKPQHDVLYLPSCHTLSPSRRWLAKSCHGTGV